MYDSDLSWDIAQSFANNLKGIYKQDGQPLVKKSDMPYVFSAIHGKGGIPYPDGTLVSIGDLRKAFGKDCTDEEIKANEELCEVLVHPKVLQFKMKK